MLYHNETRMPHHLYVCGQLYQTTDSVRVPCRFLIKVQVALNDVGMQPHCIYDQRRSFRAMVGPEQQQAYRALLQIVRRDGVNGLKVYLWCKRASDDSLKIFLDDRPQSQPLW